MASKATIKQNLRLENWSLYFDGKCIDEIEYQVVVLKNERIEVKLGALHFSEWQG